MRTARIGVLVRSALRLVLLAAVFVCASRAWADPISKEDKDKLLASAERLVEQRAYASGTDFAKWKEILAKYQERIDKAETDTQFAAALNRALKDFGISHIDITTPKIAADRKKAEMVGIGISHNNAGGGPLRDGLEIVEIIDGGPAQKAGLKIGDTILKLNGEPLAEASSLRGEEGSKVMLTVRRSGGDIEEVEVTRGKFSLVRPEKLTRLADDAVMITVPTFSTGYDRKKLETLFTEAKDDKYLVINLTSNGGGAVENMLHFMGLLLPRGTAIGTSVNKQLADKYAEETGGDPTDVVKVAAWARDNRRWAPRRNPIEPYKGKVAVLINGGSASASEIVANALRELKDAVLVGSPTAGAVLVSTPVKLEDGFEMKIPISDYVTIKGRRLEKSPTAPDIRTLARTQKEVDAAARKALERLRAGKPAEQPAEAEEPNHEAREPAPAGMP